MTAANAARITLAFLSIASLAAAQPPVRTVDAAGTDPSRSVTLSLTEYNRLIDLAARPLSGAALAPVGAVVTGADLKIRVDRDTVQGVFSLTGDVLRAGINRVPLIAGATLTAGTAQGRTLPLHSESGVQSAMLPGPGPFALTLQWGGPVSLAPGRASFTLPVPLASTVHATLDIPGDQADVHVAGGLVTGRSSGNGRTTVDVALRPGKPADVWWSMRDSAPVAAARDVRFVADLLSLVTLGDSDVRLAALLDVTVIAGEPRSLAVKLPAGYEIAGISGSSLAASEPRDGSVVLTLGETAARRHQFLITLERPHQDGSFALDTGFPSLPDAQRERGEIAIEGTGTFELDATEANVLHRIDVRELNTALRSLARSPVLAAFRYQRTPAAPAAVLAVDVTRFGDAGVLAAVADRAVATTLVTAEGRALTEIALTVQNRAQPFLKVALPAGATMVSVEVAGQPAKPVTAPDGTRVPLLRPGFRPSGPYAVSFVYLHAGTPFLKRGDRQMTLPRMDIPVGIVEWEIFVPEQYSARAIDGNAIDRAAFAALATKPRSKVAGVSGRAGGGVAGGSTDEKDRVGTMSESVIVAAESPANERAAAREQQQKAAEPSQNVINLQRRTAGVLPVRMDVPRAGTSHQFVKPLVVDQETTVSLRYKRR